MSVPSRGRSGAVLCRGRHFRKFAPIAVKAGAVVIDNSSASGWTRTCRLVIPEITPAASAITRASSPFQLRRDHRAGAAMADPPPKPYQAPDPVDLSGRQRRRAAAMEELVNRPAPASRRDLYAEGDAVPYAFQPVQPHTAIDPATGYNDEETKVIKETRKIFEDENIAVGVTCVRVPVLRAHWRSHHLRM